MSAIAQFFKFAERKTNLATEARAGLTTFLVMAYILFVNGSIIAKPLGLDPAAVAAGTALVAGLMTIAMGMIGNYPFALAAGSGHQRHRRLHADRQRGSTPPARWASSSSRASRSPCWSRSASGKRS